MITLPLIQTLRLPFLLLTPICVGLGVSAAWSSGVTIHWPDAALTLLGALCAHISVNTLNEYHDFKSGLDFHTQRTPFSGGSGSLPQHPALASTTLAISWLALLVTVCIGVYFLMHHGMKILPVGVLGLALVVFYTPWINRYPLICLIAPGLGFGVLMVLGSNLVLGGELSARTWLIAAVPFFLVNNLLLLNQLPDMTADAKAGRKTLPIVHGVRTVTQVYIGFSLLAGLAIILGVVIGLLPNFGLLACLPLGLSAVAAGGSRQYGADIGNQPKYLAANVGSALLTPLSLALGLG